MRACLGYNIHSSEIAEALEMGKDFFRPLEPHDNGSASTLLSND
jgi:hypothetical protein